MKHLFNHTALSSPFVLYILAGVLSFIIELTTLQATLTATENRPAAVTTGFVTGLISSFLLQKVLVFKDKERSKSKTSKQIAAYLILVAVNYVFTLLLVELFSDSIGITTARTIALVITTAWNFIVYKLFIFKNNRS